MRKGLARLHGILTKNSQNALLILREFSVFHDKYHQSLMFFKQAVVVQQCTVYSEAHDDDF